VLRAARHEHEVSRLCPDPLETALSFAKSLDLAGDDEECLHVAVAMDWHERTGRYGATNDAEAVVTFIRRDEELDGWAEHIEKFVRSARYASQDIFVSEHFGSTSLQLML